VGLIRVESSSIDKPQNVIKDSELSSFRPLPTQFSYNSLTFNHQLPSDFPNNLLSNFPTLSALNSPETCLCAARLQ
jgi:hypothetical protein